MTAKAVSTTAFAVILSFDLNCNVTLLKKAGLAGLQAATKITFPSIYSYFPKLN